MKKMLFFDMDGTLADLYGVAGWLEMLESCETAPYERAGELLPLAKLAQELNRLQKAGWKLCIISWTSKKGTTEYNARVEAVKREWLAQHMPSVHWNEIFILDYGTPKHWFTDKDDYSVNILFDDETKNLDRWRNARNANYAFYPDWALDILEELD